MSDPIKAGAPRTSYYKPEEDAEWEHFVCEVCGNVYKLPFSDVDKEKDYLPLCAHSSNYIWPFDRNVAKLEERGWVRMKIADVRVRDL